MPAPAPPETHEQRQERIVASIKTRFDNAVATGGKFVLVNFDYANDGAAEFVSNLTRLAREHPSVTTLQFIHLEGDHNRVDEKDMEDCALLTLKQD